jgi:5-methylcytosine-specific restriction endonuclease McrA
MTAMSSTDSVTEAPVKKCKKGHLLTPDNIEPGGRKGRCKTCSDEIREAWKEADPGYDSDSQHRVRMQGGKGNAAPALPSVNALKTRCDKGHEYTEENTYHCGPDGRRRQCKTCRAENVRKSYRRHREKRLAEQKAKRDANPEIHRENSRRWQQENRERSNLLSRIKKQRRRNAGTLTVADWELVLDVYGRNCLKCGKPEVTIDHVVPTSCGGANEIRNVQPLCGFCNTSKGTKTADYRPFPWEAAAEETAREDAA